MDNPGVAPHSEEERRLIADTFEQAITHPPDGAGVLLVRDYRTQEILAIEVSEDAPYGMILECQVDVGRD